MAKFTLLLVAAGVPALLFDPAIASSQVVGEPFVIEDPAPPPRDTAPEAPLDFEQADAAPIWVGNAVPAAEDAMAQEASEDDPTAYHAAAENASALPHPVVYPPPPPPPPPVMTIPPAQSWAAVAPPMLALPCGGEREPPCVLVEGPVGTEFWVVNKGTFFRWGGNAGSMEQKVSRASSFLIQNYPAFRISGGYHVPRIRQAQRDYLVIPKCENLVRYRNRWEVQLPPAGERRIRLACSDD